ncbi:transposase [Palaeococcus sp. (in: euryarchaeotes)]
MHKSGGDNPKALTVLILWQFYADRATDWIKKELNLTQIPDRQTLNRGQKKITPEYLSNLNKLILEQTNTSKLAAHSTGLKNLQKTSDMVRKRHVLYDLESRTIVSLRVTEGSRHDSQVFRDVFWLFEPGAVGC